MSGKGSGRRASAVSSADYADAWARTFSARDALQTLWYAVTGEELRRVTPPSDTEGGGIKGPPAVSGAVEFSLACFGVLD